MQNFFQYLAEFFSQNGWETLLRPGNRTASPIVGDTSNKYGLRHKHDLPPIF